MAVGVGTERPVQAAVSSWREGVRWWGEQRRWPQDCQKMRRTFVQPVRGVEQIQCGQDVRNSG